MSGVSIRSRLPGRRPTAALAAGASACRLRLGGDNRAARTAAHGKVHDVEAAGHRLDVGDLVALFQAGYDLDVVIVAVAQGHFHILIADREPLSAFPSWAAVALSVLTSTRFARG